jgi:carbamoyltransferase
MKYNIKNLEFKKIDKLLKFLSDFNVDSLKINHNYLIKDFFLDFFKIEKTKKIKSLILEKNNKIFGFRGIVQNNYQISKNKIIDIHKGHESLLWFSKSQKIDSLKLLTEDSNVGIFTSAAYGSTQKFYELNGYQIFDLNRYVLPIDFKKFKEISQFKNFESYFNILVFNHYILEPKEIDPIRLEKIWFTISNQINIFSRYRDRNFWEWRYKNCKYFKYIYWDCPNGSGVVVARVEKVFDKKFKNKNFKLLRIMEILPTSKKIWQNKNDTNFEIFLSSILSWCNKEGLFAVDYHISELCFHNFLKKIGFQLENHDKRYLPPVFSPIKNNHRPLNIAFKIKKYITGSNKNRINYFVKSDGGADFPQSYQDYNDLNSMNKENLKLAKNKNLKRYIILGIHDGFDCSACIMINGKIVYAAQEERFSGLKTDYGLPTKAIKAGLKFLNLKIEDIDEVALATNSPSPVITKLKREANFSVKDYIEEQENYWKPLFYEKKIKNYHTLYKNKKFKTDNIYNYKNLLSKHQSKKLDAIFLKRRQDKISSLFKINKNKIKIITHEDCHKFYSYFFFKDRRNGIAITAEGMGDYSRGSVSTVKNGNFKLISHSLDNHLGNIYKYITLLLGMKPGHHEYKVMGLAPYASEYEINKCYKVFNDILKIKDLNVVFKKKPKDLFYHFKNKFLGARFDGIAGALQKFLETKLLEWFLACSKKLSLKTFYFSGGVAQNIKAGMHLNLSKKLDKIFIPPSAGDSSISLGACYVSASNYCEKNNLSKMKYIKHVEDLYLGTSNSKSEIEDFIKDKNIQKNYFIKKNVKPKDIAKEIYNGKIIARCSGRMEFGLRSLGNRSILCDPRFYSNISKINIKIKKRDFWMPFTPSILEEDFDKYISDPKKLNSYFMSMAFHTTKLGKKNIQAAIHPADFTARPQKLIKSHNENYYNIVKEFKKLSGVGALLNTSFNLHGLPIARTPKEAFYVFKNSDLDILVIEDYIFKKKNNI